MPIVNGRLTCCQCGADLGDAEDQYRDPDCLDCLRRQEAEEMASEAPCGRFHGLLDECEECDIADAMACSREDARQAAQELRDLCDHGGA